MALSPRGQGLELVVVGTGRCGTKFVAKFLTSAGLPCAHEAFFSWRGLRGLERRIAQHKFVAESSWLAVPFLNCDLLKDAVIVHLVRHPKPVMESWLRDPPERIRRYDDFRLRHLAGLADHEREIDKAACRYVGWNEMIERQNRDCVRFRIEDDPAGLLRQLSARRLVDLNTLDIRFLFDDRKCNHRRGTPVEVRLVDVGLNLREELIDMSARYGYGWG